MIPTPTAPDRSFRPGDFRSIREALAFAGTQPTGVNIHSARGELVEVLPYADLAAQAEALAGRLLASGLEPGDRVALAADSTGDFLRAFFACQFAGLAPATTPLPAPFGGKEAYVAHIRRMMQAADARAAMAPAELGPWFAEAAEGLGMVVVGGIADLPPAAAGPLPEPDPAGLCYLQFSSGSTRFPLGVAVSHAALMANVSAIGGPQGLAVRPSDRAISWLPLYHDMGLVGMLLTGLAFQVSIDLLPTSAFVRRPGLWLQLISERRGSISYAPTFGFDLAARRGPGPSAEALDLSSWRIAGIGGDMIRPGPLRAFTETYAEAGFDGRAFVASYGMAETTLALSLTPVGEGLRTDLADLERLEQAGLAVPARPGARSREFALCGRALPGHLIEVRGPDNTALRERQVGRIFASGPSLMKVYFGAPEETAQVLSPDGWLDTGDLGYLLDGQIVITGRAKDLIIVHGRNVWPQDLEWTAENEIDALRSGDMAVFSDTSAEPERVVALVQCRLRDATERDALRARIGAVLRAGHGLEVEVVLVPPHSLPQTSSGKLSRTRARAMFLAGDFAKAGQPVSA